MYIKILGITPLLKETVIAFVSKQENGTVVDVEFHSIPSQPKLNFLSQQCLQSLSMI